MPIYKLRIDISRFAIRNIGMTFAYLHHGLVHAYNSRKADKNQDAHKQRPRGEKFAQKPVPFFEAQSNVKIYKNNDAAEYADIREVTKAAGLIDAAHARKVNDERLRNAAKRRERPQPPAEHEERAEAERDIHYFIPREFLKHQR